MEETVPREAGEHRPLPPSGPEEQQTRSSTPGAAPQEEQHRTTEMSPREAGGSVQEVNSHCPCGPARPVSFGLGQLDFLIFCYS